MKTAFAIVLTLTLAILSGCQTSPRGGSQVKDQGFKISVPAFGTDVKQGELLTLAVTVQRDSLFKEDVELHIKAAKGINVEPDKVTIKASDRPEVQLQITAPKDAALGEYPVVVTGKPDVGAATSVGFTVTVVAP